MLGIFAVMGVIGLMLAILNRISREEDA